MKKTRPRIGSSLWAHALILPLLPVTALANDATNVTYLNKNGKKATCASATVVEDSTSTWSGGTDSPNWYVVNQNVTIEARIEVSGKVNLILADDCTLTAKKGIHVGSGNSLTIFGQSAGSGTLTAELDGDADIGYAGIGGDRNDGTHGGIIINGGIVKAVGGEYAAGIGGGNPSKTRSGNITINGGSVTATGGTGAAGIGGGGSNTGNGGNITITGGTVNATGGDNAAGIGSGNHDQQKIGRTITIEGDAYVIAQGGLRGAGIGSGASNKAGNISAIAIGGDAEVNATGGLGGAGIGGSYGGAEIGAITIDGNAQVTAFGGNWDEASGDISVITSGGAGIGSGGMGGGSITGSTETPGNIVIAGGTVEATGGNGKYYVDKGASSGAGIGSGGSPLSAVGDIVINAGTVTATGGKDAAGIGSGTNGTSGTFSTQKDGSDPGSAVIHASSISDNTDTTDWNGIIFQGMAGKVYGDVTLEEDLEIESSETLEVPEGARLTVAEDATLTNNGAITNEGEILVYGELKGTVEEGSNQPVANPVASYTDSTEKTVLAETLQEAVTKAADNTIVRLLQTYDASGKGTLTIDNGKKITLDLGGYTLTLSRFDLKHGQLTVQNGDVECSGQAFNVYAAPASDDSSDYYTKLTLAKDATINAAFAICLFPAPNSNYGANSAIEVYGEIKNGGIFVSGNLGNDTASAADIVASGKVPTIHIYEGAVVTSSTEAQGIAMNGLAYVTVDGGTITGSEAIGVKRGKLTVNGGTFISNGKYVDPAEANNNGTENTGATISITSTYNYAGTIDVTIKGGTFTSEKASAVYLGHSKKTNDEYNAYKNGVSLNISGGTFISADVGPVYIADTIEGDQAYSKQVITGGTFSVKPDEAYLAEGYQAVHRGDQWGVDKAVQSVTLSASTLPLELNGSQTLTATVSPADAYGEVTWTTSDVEGDVVTITKGEDPFTVTVKATGVGEATITAKAGNKEATCTVTVSYAEVTSITLDQTEVTLAAGGTTELKATVLPDNADQNVTWTSSDDKIASVNNGKITGINEGTATITATAVDGKSVECKVIVTAEGDVIVNVAEPDVTVKISGVNLSEDQTEAIKNTAKSVNADAAIAAAAKEVSDGLDVDALTAQAREDLDAGVDVPIYLFTQAYLEITATGAEIDENGKIASLTLDIKPMVRVLASTAGSIKDLDDENSVVVQQAAKLTISGDASIQLTLPSDLAGVSSLYIRHEKDAEHTYYYKGTVTDGTLSFLNPHGFSAFTFPADSEVAAAIGNQGYATLKDAVNNASNKDTIILNQNNGEAITVQKNITFTLDKSGHNFTGTISAGAGYEMTTVTNEGKITYTFTRISTGGSGSSDVSGDYIISVNKTAGGKVTVNPGRADKGDEVTITAIPNDGYVLQSLTVTDKDGDTVRVSSEGRDKYTFTMPGSTVTVKAVFAPEGSAVVTPEISFTDVAENFWAYNEIQWAAENGYMTGTTATTFNPNGTVTRQQVWMILARMSGARPADMAAAKAWAVNNGISDGTNPGGAVTRQQLVALLYRFAGQYGYDVSAKADLSGYPDVASLASYAADAMAWSVANGIIGGTTQGTLNPAGTANRAQFAVILWRFYQTTAV